MVSGVSGSECRVGSSCRRLQVAHSMRSYSDRASPSPSLPAPAQCIAASRRTDGQSDERRNGRLTGPPGEKKRSEREKRKRAPQLQTHETTHTDRCVIRIHTRVLLFSCRCAVGSEFEGRPFLFFVFPWPIGAAAERVRHAPIATAATRPGEYLKRAGRIRIRAWAGSGGKAETCSQRVGGCGCHCAKGRLSASGEASCP